MKLANIPLLEGVCIIFLLSSKEYLSGCQAYMSLYLGDWSLRIYSRSSGPSGPCRGEGGVINPGFTLTLVASTTTTTAEATTRKEQLSQADCFLAAVCNRCRLMSQGHRELGELDCERFWRQCVDIPSALVSNVGSFQEVTA